LLHLAIESAPAALVGESRVAESVAQDPAASRKRRLDHLCEVLAARGEHEDRLGLRLHRDAQDELAQLLAHWRSARLARHDEIGTAGADAAREELDMRRFAGAIDAFQRDEFSARHFLSWYLATARLCSSSDFENWWVPSPFETK